MTCLKSLLKKNPGNIILHIGTNNSVNEASGDILNEYYLWKTIEKLCPRCKVIVSNLIYRLDNGKASRNVKDVNDCLDALKVDVVDNRWQLFKQ